MTDRMDRVKEMIKREVSVILQEDINDPRIQHVMITRVEVTRDLRLAKIFYSLSADEKDKQGIEKGLKSASSFIRHELAERTSMKFTPRILFREDKEEEEEESVDRIFEEIEREHHDRSRNDEGKDA